MRLVDVRFQPMTYFPDLAPYTYCDPEGIEGGGEDLCVGWLEHGHDFPRGDVPPGLVDALVLCSTRPVRLCKGLHHCDLCLPAARDVRAAPMDMAGPASRQFGCGEVRVRGSDGRWYAAPTLVAHYVHVHGYRPPAPFVQAVLRKAAEFYVLAGVQLDRLTALSIEDQLDVCVRALAAIPSRAPAALAAVCERLRMRDGGVFDMDELDALPGDVLEACWVIADAFSCREPLTDDERQSRVRECLIQVLERASDLGVDATAF